MADRIKPIDAIDGSSLARVAERLSPPGQRSLSREPQADEHDRLRIGAPADVVELSVDPQTVRQLPPTVYLKFLVDPESGKVVVQVIDAVRNEVIRQVPPGELRKTLGELGG